MLDHRQADVARHWCLVLTFPGRSMTRTKERGYVHHVGVVILIVGLLDQCTVFSPSRFLYASRASRLSALALEIMHSKALTKRSCSFGFNIDKYGQGLQRKPSFYTKKEEAFKYCMRSVHAGNSRSVVKMEFQGQKQPTGGPNHVAVVERWKGPACGRKKLKQMMQEARA